MTLLAHLRSWMARHPRVYWSGVIALAALVAWHVQARAQHLDDAVRAWGDTVTVWVASADLAPGDPVAARAVDYPVALASPGRLDRDPAGLVAVQHLGVGEVITSVDVGRNGLELLPSGWRGVAIAPGDSTPTLAPGTRVDVVAAGELLVGDAVVVAVEGEAVIVGVPAEAAAATADAVLHAEASLVIRAD